MAQNTSVGSSFLEGFLRIMVFALVIILIAIPVCILLDKLGIFDMLGWQF
ncbi:hypothetical protein [Croceitalea rosinachiae]|uniref:Uncharacterized protein n=1 Tax=Croceitalea rosinachiae TaxID=3075596 RepID=A0ABU3A761_9FLAO|nr:hypothetical protein [Croceitalea sp. F388]MDT0605745.1 hypothetical protein [Croceitalea sp. F388]